MGRLGAVVKVGCEFAIAALIVLAAAPLMALIALCVVLESPGPVFYRAERVGRSGKRIWIFKFRKMYLGASGSPLTLDHDQRFTRIGRLLARTKLDELPQLLNVLRRDMSLIGPRPEDPWFVARHREAFAPILRVRPGITGLSQLAYATEARILDQEDPIRHYEARILPQKLHLDNLYVTRWHLGLDLRIMLWTLATTLLGIPVSVSRATGRMTVRRRGKSTAFATVRTTASDELYPVVPQFPLDGPFESLEGPR